MYKFNREKSLRRTANKWTERVATVLFFFFVSIAVSAQQKSLSGTVLDESNIPVTGASVLVNGTSNAAITDVNGRFTLKNVMPDATIKISFIGYFTQNLAVKNQTMMNVVLKENVRVLDDVVVIGYGTTTRKNITGAVDQVSSKAIENRPVANVTQALQGASANLIIQQRSSNPNDNAMNINIRGVSTMGNNTPLIVIDGVVSNTNAMGDINPSDIDNVSVLKDAGSAAIYGSRSANGVILITTKTGNKDQVPVIKFSAQAGIQQPKMLFEQVHGWENAIYMNEAAANAGSSLVYTSAQIQDLYDHGDGVPFQDQILKNGLQKNYNVNVQGGSGNSSYMISAGMFDQRSNFVGPDYGVKRYNFRSNLTTQIGRLKLTGNMMYTRYENKTHTGDTGFIMVDCTRVPLYYYYKMKNDDGSLYYTNNVLSESNPMGTLEKLGTSTSDNDYITGNYSGEFKIMDGLKLKGVLGAEIRSDHRYTRQFPVWYATSLTATEATYKGGAVTLPSNDWSGKSTFLNTQLLLDYNKTFGDHTVSALAGYSDESSRYAGITVSKTYVDLDLGIPVTTTKVGTDSKLSPEDFSENSIKSFFGRANYSYKDKYYVEANMRIDKSSKFAPKYRTGYFPSIAGGWRISEEAFAESYKANVGDLKIRSSYGILGNQDGIGNYDYQTVYTMYNNTYSFNNAATSGTGFAYGNEALTWENSANFNIGIDATFLNNTLFINADYFNKQTTGILLSPVIPATFGGSVATQNLGTMQNRGWEFTANYRLKSGDFNHAFSLNVADSKNKVTKYGDEKMTTSDGVGFIIREGLALGSYFGYKTDGLFQSEEEIANSALPLNGTVVPGDVKYKNLNGDNVIDEKDRTVLGNAFPRYTFGFTYNVSFKGFDFSTMLQGVGKRDFIVRGELIEPFHSSYSYTMYKHQKDYWTPENTDARWPRLAAPGSKSNSNNFNHQSDFAMESGAYLRVKNVQLGYTLPKNLTSKVGCENLRLYIDAQNLFTLSSCSFVDPETSEFGNNMGGTGGQGGANSARNYPSLKYYGFGVDLSF